MIYEKLGAVVGLALKELGVKNPQVTLEHPADLSHGDYSTNAALAYAKELGLSPRVLAEKIVANFNKHIAEKTEIKEAVESVSIAGPGFINITLHRAFFNDQVSSIIKSGKKFGTNKKLSGKKIVLDYTNPNPFKTFHIGHLMANAIGEALSRIIEAQGANVIRVNYQGDVGLHVAKAVWGMLQNEATFPSEKASLEDMVSYINRSYVSGSAAYETADAADSTGAEEISNGTAAKEEIMIINKMLFDRSNPKLMRIYNWGRKVSLLKFDAIYKKLGTKFDHYFFESEVAQDGIAIVNDFLKRGVFEESEGAVVFKGEQYGLHTRVFITSQGLPTYETKEVGLTRIKFDRFNPDYSIVVTANEQNDYFKVVLKALSIMFPYMEDKMKHINHGMLRFAQGKMASRKGNVIAGESLLNDVAVLAKEKMKDRELTADEKEQTITDVSVGAVKYSILRQATGSDIIYDFEKSISFEGDSGPYLQYSTVRARSILAKAKKAKIKSFSTKNIFGKRRSPSVPAKISTLEKLLYRFPEVVARAGESHEPHHIVTYLVELAAAFNAYYANEQIIDPADKTSPYKVALTHAFEVAMTNGLTMLGIRIPEKM